MYVSAPAGEVVPQALKLELRLLVVEKPLPAEDVLLIVELPGAGATPWLKANTRLKTRRVHPEP